MASKYVGWTYVIFVLFISFFGLVILTKMLEQPTPQYPGIEFSGRRVLIGLIYDFICVAGIVTVFFPGPCSRVFGIRRNPNDYTRGLNARTTEVLGFVLLHGHHREDSTATHEFRFGEKNYCASCFGLFAGSILSLMMITAFLLFGWTDIYLTRIMYVAGVAGAVLGLIPVVVSVGTWSRFILGAIFVTGTCLILIAAEIMAGNLLADLLVILLSIFWLLFRISSSHRRLQGSRCSKLPTGRSV
jgi:hypothetical protein